MQNQLVLDLNLDFDIKSNLNELESELKTKYNDDSIRIHISDNSIYLQTKNSRETILNESFLKFKTYLLKATETPGYKSNQFYSLNSCSIIIKNIENDDLIVKMYAEYLQPDIDLVSLTKLNLVSNSFHVTYSQAVDKSKLTTRFNKKPSLNNWKIELIDSYATQSLLIWCDLSKLDLTKFNLDNLFYEFYSNKYLLIQFKSQNDLDEFVKHHLNEAYKYEQVYNFDLIKSLLKRSFKSLVKVSEKQLIVHTLPFFKQIQMETVNAFNIDSLIKMELNYVFYLNESNPFVVGLLNSSQLLVNLNVSLNQIGYECKLDAEKRLTLSLKSNIESSAQYDTRKLILKEHLETFCAQNFLYQIFELNTKQSLPNDFETKLSDQCQMLNKRFTAVYLNYENKRLHTYSSVNSLNKVLKQLEKHLIDLIDKNQVIPMVTPKNKIIFNSNTKFNLPKLNDLNGDTLQLSLKYPILSKSLLNCHKILTDFKSDLKTIDGELFESDVHGLCIQSKSDQLNRFLSNYERNLLREETIKLNATFEQEDELNQLINQISNETNLNELKQIMNLFYKSDKVVQVEMTSANEFELYGYAKAVTGFKEYILKQTEKCLKKIAHQDELKLEFKIKLPQELGEALFSRFDGVYLSDLIKRLQILDAFATQLQDNNVLLIGCLNKKLTQQTNKTKTTNSRDITEWRSRVDEFFRVYIDKMKFSREIIQVAFERDDAQADEFMYDKNSLDLKWISTNQIEAFGLSSELNKLKQRLVIFSK